MQKDDNLATSYPVFKGLGRKPTFMGIPTTYALGGFIAVAIIAMTIGLAWWGLLFIVMPTIAVITKNDDKAFDVLWLELKTRKSNRNKKFWQGSSYAPNDYPKTRPWIALLEENKNG